MRVPRILHLILGWTAGVGCLALLVALNPELLPLDHTGDDLKHLEMQIASYYQDTGVLPKHLSDLISNNGTLGWNGPYAKDTDIYTRLGGDIQYQASPPSTFRISAIGRYGAKVEDVMSTR